MNFSWVNEIDLARWAPTIVGYLLGLVTGVVIWAGGGLRADEEMPKRAEPARAGDEMGNAPPQADHRDDDSEVAIKIGAIEAELRKARTRLEADAQENAAFGEILSNLDEAIKRANGRLKLIVKAVKHARGRE